MKKKKEFDCVQMKEEVQAKLLKEYEGLSDEEVSNRRQEKIESHPVIGPLYRKIDATQVGI